MPDAPKAQRSYGHLRDTMLLQGTEPESSVVPWPVILVTLLILRSLDACKGLLESRIDTFVSNWVLAVLCIGFVSEVH